MRIAFALVLACSVSTAHAEPRPTIAVKAKKVLRSLGNQLGIGAGNKGVEAGTSTPLQKALVATQALATAVTLHSMNGGHALASAGLVYAGYQAADLAGGVVHWGLDNYGTKDTPILGTQIEDFQTHHDHPQLVGKRTIPDLMAPLALVGTPMMLAIAHMPKDEWGLKAALFGFAAGFVLNPIGHKFAHMKEAGPVVETMRTLRLFIQPRDHAQHHREPHDENYGVMSGFTNPLTNKLKIHRRLEALVYKTTGTVPNTWKEKGGRKVMADALGPDESTWPDISR